MIAAQALHPFSFPDAAIPEIRRRTASQAAAKGLRPGLGPLLSVFNAELGQSAKRSENIRLLASGEAAAVVTGQQVGLYLGPLFTLYKALSAIAAADLLTTETGRPVVPVFWMQTEDHDFREIRTAIIPDRESNQLILSLPPDDDVRLPVNERTLAPEVTGLQSKLDEALGHLPAAGPILAMTRESYAPGQSLAFAFGKLLASLTADFGLVFFNPRSPAVAQYTKEIYARCLSEHEAIAEKLLSRSAELEKRGRPLQVRLQPESPLFFLHTSPAGWRQRLIRRPGGWEVSHQGELLETSAVLSLLDAAPERFSTSALLRPIVQDSLLPTAAYVGGDAELNYFHQLSPLYDHFGLGRPMVLRRAGFTLIDDKLRRWLDELGLGVSDFSAGRAALERKAASRKESRFAPPDQVEAALNGALQAALGSYRPAFSELDPTLAQSSIKTEEKIAHLVHALVDRYSSALARSDQVVLQRLSKMENILFPGAVSQERRYSPLAYLCRYGTPLMHRLLAEIEPFGAQHKDLQL